MSAEDCREAEQARLHEMMAVCAAESTVASARIEELRAAQETALRRHRAAKGLLTRARNEGSAAKIAAAEREREAYAEFDRVRHEAIEEMLAINGVRLDAFGHLQNQMGRAWADAAALDELRGREPEAGQ